MIPYPFVFLVGAVVFDAAAYLVDLRTFWGVGHYLSAVGLVTALVAAIPGLIDYLATVPPHSAARRRATRLIVVDLTAVALFAVSWLTRSVAQPDPQVLALELFAGLVLGVGAWFGGAFMFRTPSARTPGEGSGRQVKREGLSWRLDTKERRSAYHRSNRRSDPAAALAPVAVWRTPRISGRRAASSAGPAR